MAGTGEKTVEEPESEPSSPGLARWKLALLAMGATAGFAGGLLNGVAAAMGSAVGVAAVYYITIQLATIAYERIDAFQIGVIPKRVYVAICLVSGLLAIPGALVMQSPGSGVFLFVYGILGTLALGSFGIISAIQGKRSGTST